MNTPNSIPRVLSWLLGGLSLISLVSTFISLRFADPIHSLLSSYITVIDALFDFATGWTGLPWFNISPIERHFIVIMVICQSALLNTHKRYGENYAVFAIGVALFAIADTLIFGVMPDSFYMSPLFVALVILLGPLYLERSGDMRLHGYTANLVGITIFCVTIATVNYVLTSVS